MDAHIKDLTEHTYSAQLYDELWEYVEVIKGLSEYIALAPKSAGVAYHNRAVSYWETGETEKALADLDRAFERLPENPFQNK